MKKVENQKTKKYYKNDETSEPQSTNPSDPDSRFDGTTQGMKTYRNATPGEKKGKLYEVVKSVVREALDKLEEEDPCWKGYKMLGMKKKNGRKVPNCVKEDAKGYKSPSGGLTKKGREHYNREEGGHLQAPVTTPPSELKPGSRAANRRKSFCARMSGVEGPMKKPNGEPTRKALALRKWNCE
jgi:hypothetical protein